VKQAKLIGVLYLENRLAPGIFTPQRIVVLELLASQAAISLGRGLKSSDREQSYAQLRPGTSVKRPMPGLPLDCSIARAAFRTASVIRTNDQYPSPRQTIRMTKSTSFSFDALSFKDRSSPFTAEVLFLRRQDHPGDDQHQDRSHHILPNV
jgi:hypothetical protein